MCRWCCNTTSEIWRRCRPSQPLRLVHDEPFRYDVQRRVPSVEKAYRLLGFRAETPLGAVLDEVIPWVEQQVALGNL